MILRPPDGMRGEYELAPIGESGEPRALAAEVEDDEELDDEGPQKAEEVVMGEHIVNEVLIAVWEARYLGPLLALLGLWLGYQLTIAPYRFSVAEKSVADVELWKIRPILAEEEQRLIRLNTMNAETEFKLPLPSYDTIKLRFHSAATHKGIHQPPELFYEGVTFGLSDANSHGLQYHAHRNLQYDDMYGDLVSMRPQPTSVMVRSSQLNSTGWKESGYAVYFSYKDLARQGKLSSDKLQPWKRVLDDVLVIARNYHQVCITAWYPHEFGRPSPEEDKFRDQNDADYDKHLYETVLQQVIPTRTGLTYLRSTVPVWMSAINSSTPVNRKLVYQKEWTEDDHYTHYRKGGLKHYDVSSLYGSKTRTKTIEL